jgi:hypothetical protein
MRDLQYILLENYPSYENGLLILKSLVCLLIHIRFSTKLFFDYKIFFFRKWNVPSRLDASE